ncbi:MAG: Ni/Fe hydrogenase subunit alpha [Terriglobales bacterium]
MKRITIEPVSRIEGHAKITIQLNDSGHVDNAELHVTQVRGFEKLTEGRPYYEMPGITARICGICPISHLLASAKACDAIMAVRIPPAARKLRELIHCAQFVQSHALSFFYLSSPDLILGMDSYPATRNVLGVIQSHPELARDGIELRKFGLQIIETLGQERVHSSWIVPGGVKSPMTIAMRDKILAELPHAKQIAERTLQFFKSEAEAFKEDIAKFGCFPTMYLGMVDGNGDLQLYEGNLRFRAATDEIVSDQIAADDYAEYISEATLKNSYLKAPFYKPMGIEGMYRVGPLARLNVAVRCGTPKADHELAEFRQRYGKPAHSAFLYHHARLIEIVYALERIEALLADGGIVDEHVRATAGVNSHEGVGMIEAPRGVLIHHYKVNGDGAITWANLIVATGHNNLAMGQSVKQVATEYVHGDKIEEGMLNRVSAVVRAYDPCLSCSTHADGTIAMQIRLLSAKGELLHELCR